MPKRLKNWWKTLSEISEKAKIRRAKSPPYAVECYTTITYSRVGGAPSPAKITFSELPDKKSIYKDKKRTKAIKHRKGVY